MSRILVAATIVVTLAGCAVGYVGNFSFPDVKCRMLGSLCVIELPAIGYLGVGPSAILGAVDQTKVSFRLAPREGVVAAWASAEITLVDLDNNKSVQLKALDTKQVVGHYFAPHVDEDEWVLYGAYAPGEFYLKPRITNMEVRFPLILLDGRTVQVPPVRIYDGLRTPKAVIPPLH
jgi:hypothetical protein